MQDESSIIAKSQEPRAKSRNYALKFLSLTGRIIISAILALNFLYFVSFYDTDSIAVLDPDRVTDVRGEPMSLHAQAQEGFAFGWLNNEGYNNTFNYTRGMSIDILVMGASHVLGSQLFVEDIVSSVLGRLSGRTIYNTGQSGNYFLECTKNIKEAAEKYRPEYIVVETGAVKFSNNKLKMVADNTLPAITEKDRGILRQLLRQNRYLRFLWFKLKFGVLDALKPKEDLTTDINSPELLNIVLQKIKNAAQSTALKS